jgi:hypothetical protein
MGHILGLHHQGDTNWSYDGYLPTMMQCPSSVSAAPTETLAMQTIQQDDWGGAAYLRGGARRYWNSNPGFEDDFAHWGHSAGAVLGGSTYAVTGSKGVLLDTSADYVYMTSVYDPWFGYGDTGAGTEIVGMDTSSPVLRSFGFYKHPLSSTTGGVVAQYNFRFLQYSQTACKRNGFIGHTTWSGITTVATCGDPGTTWTSCDGGVTVDNSLTNDATVFRVYLDSTSSGDVYVDKVGAYGGTTP